MTEIELLKWDDLEQSMIRNRVLRGRAKDLAILCFDSKSCSCFLQLCGPGLLFAKPWRKNGVKFMFRWPPNLTFLLKVKFVLVFAPHRDGDRKEYRKREGEREGERDSEM